MKKLLSFVIVLCLSLTFAACSDTASSGIDDDNDAKASTASSNASSNNSSVSSLGGASDSNEIDAQYWAGLSDAEKFNNFTFTMNAKFLSGYEDADPEGHTEFYRIDGDWVSENRDVAVQSPGTIKSVKELMLKIVFDTIKDHTKYETVESGAFKSNESISFDLDVSLGMSNYTAKITSENVEIKTKDGYLTYFKCKMTQDITVEDDRECFVLDVEFIFSDYGTTDPREVI